MSEAPPVSKPIFEICSDRPLIRFALRRLLEPEYPEYEFRMKDPSQKRLFRVHSSSEDGPLPTEAPSPIPEVPPPPDLAIFELSPRYGICLQEATEHLKRMREPKMLVLTPIEETFHVGQVLATGVMGCLSHRADPEEILTAMRQISQGRIFVNDASAKEMLHHRSESPRYHRDPHETTDPVSRLTHRESEVFRLFGAGYSTKQIAYQLSLNVHTIETYRERIRMRIQARDGSELIYRAILWCIMNG